MAAVVAAASRQVCARAPPIVTWPRSPLWKPEVAPGSRRPPEPARGGAAETRLGKWGGGELRGQDLARPGRQGLRRRASPPAEGGWDAESEEG